MTRRLIFILNIGEGFVYCIQKVLDFLKKIGTFYQKPIDKVKSVCYNEDAKGAERKRGR